MSNEFCSVAFVIYMVVYFPLADQIFLAASFDVRCSEKSIRQALMSVQSIITIDINSSIRLYPGQLAVIVLRISPGLPTIYKPL